jgi:hypothetical protein
MGDVLDGPEGAKKRCTHDHSVFRFGIATEAEVSYF